MSIPMVSWWYSLTAFDIVFIMNACSIVTIINLHRLDDFFFSPSYFRFSSLSLFHSFCSLTPSQKEMKAINFPPFHSNLFLKDLSEKWFIFMYFQHQPARKNLRYGEKKINQCGKSRAAEKETMKFKFNIFFFLWLNGADCRHFPTLIRSVSTVIHLKWAFWER